jgi:hypothetical protein
MTAAEFELESLEPDAALAPPVSRLLEVTGLSIC